VARDETILEAERIANLGVIIFAGFETTTGLLSKGVEALLRHPDQWVHLRDALIADDADRGSDAPDREWRWLSWAKEQPERTVAGERFSSLLDILAASPPAAARFEAVRTQERMLDDAVEEMLRWTAPGTVVPLTASKDMSVELESDMEIKGRAF